MERRGGYSSPDLSLTSLSEGSTSSPKILGDLFKTYSKTPGIKPDVFGWRTATAREIAAVFELEAS